jgi:DNA-binding transcriptional MerR regulator
MVPEDRTPWPSLGGRVYTFSDAERITGVHRGHLDKWVRLGVITPDGGGGGTSGVDRLYSARNLMEIAVGVALQPTRVHVSALKAAVDMLREHDDRVLSTARFLVLEIADGRPIARLAETVQFHDGRIAVAVNFATITRVVSDAIK